MVVRAVGRTGIEGSSRRFALTCECPAGLQVRGVPPSEAKVFNEYVLPSLSLLPSEGELAVQVGWRGMTAVDGPGRCQDWLPPCHRVSPSLPTLPGDLTRAAG